MHILIIEPGSTGHHLIYLEKIAKGYLESNNDITLSILKSTREHPIIKNLEANYKSRITFADIADDDYKSAMTSKLLDIGRELKMRNIFKEVYEKVTLRHRVDYVFLPYLDYCLYSVGLLGSPFGNTQWGGICMRPSFHYEIYNVVAPKPKLSKIKKLLFKRCLSIPTLKKIYTIDEILEKYISDHFPKLRKRIVYIPDPAELKGNHSSLTARAQLDIPKDAKVILVYGALNDRKGIQPLIEALCLANCHDNLHLLLVGKQSEVLKSSIQVPVHNLTMKKKLHILDRFVCQDEEQMAFAASDIVWLGYQGHFTMSGVLVLAATSGKPIIGTQQGLIGWYIQNQKLGICVDTQNQAAIINALNQLVTEIETNEFAYKSSHFINHNWEFFLRTLSLTEAE